ncbi:hypothetical protein ACEN2J_16725 [Pseudorhodobacter sp. W20_MBD10_FR17]|uniref:hypothetical protein n=1 Tax=Pseudorhodobacter sp. W20_MBD10_FR17 TaxID=3240266 RepID=UPI003F9DED2D
MSVSSFEREIILELFKCQNWFDLYSMHERLRLSPAQVAYTVSKLSANGSIEVDGTKARLTEQGRLWVLKNRRALFLDVKRPWADSKFVSEQGFEAGQPYLPRLKSIDRTYFRKN